MISDNDTVFISSLGSGSGGNAYVVETSDCALIIDQGFSCRELLARMKKLDIDPAKLCGALLTHEHVDHSCGSRVFCNKHKLPFYTASKTALYLKNRKTLPDLVRVFEPGEEFEAGCFRIRSFPTSHDAVDPVGFTIRCNDVKIGFATDLGIAGENVKRELRNSHTLVVESNYDHQMLMNSNRRLELKRRIYGARGHLANPDTCTLLGDILSEETSLLLLAHVSMECNDHSIIDACCREKLSAMNMNDLKFEILSQSEPRGKFAIKPYARGNN